MDFLQVSKTMAFPSRFNSLEDLSAIKKNVLRSVRYQLTKMVPDQRVDDR